MKLKIILPIIALLFLVSCTPNEAAYKSTVPVTQRPAFEDRVIPQEVEKTPTEEVVTLPAQINLDVPFYPQAPEADWSMPWQEACEEASIILAYYYATDQDLTKEQFKEDIWGLVDWQVENFGDYIHSTVDQTTQMLEGYFDFTDYFILENPTIEDIQKELAAGHAIVAPFAGRMLENPFYSGEGPYYHMLVIKGYDETHFITNDVGTKRGLNFIYTYDTMISALHDYHVSEIQSAPKRIIVFK